MYRILKEGSAYMTERLKWVKLQQNGIYVLCDEPEGQGIVHDGEIYHVSGRSAIDKPTVDVVWTDDTQFIAFIEGLMEGYANE